MDNTNPTPTSHGEQLQAKCVTLLSTMLSSNGKNTDALWRTDGPETPTEWKSETGANGVGARDFCILKRAIAKGRVAVTDGLKILALA